MLKLYSKIEPKTLLHMIFRKEEICEGRTDIAPEDQFIQVSALKMHKGKTFRPHQHIWKTPHRNLIIAQESWCILAGKVKIFLYDINGVLLLEEILNAGDISVTYEGGHTYEILEDDTLVYEYKTGPYEGQGRDKVFLE